MHQHPIFKNGFRIFRAEILYRLSIPPFEVARDVLSPLSIANAKSEVKIESNIKDAKSMQKLDILQLCNIVPNEVLALPTGGKGVSYFPFLHHLYKFESQYHAIVQFIFYSYLFVFSTMLIMIQNLRKSLKIGYNAIQRTE